MTFNVNVLNSYLDKVLPAQNPNPSTGKWVYNNKVVTYLNNPAQEERILENALDYMNQDFKAFYDGIDLQEGKSIDPDIKEKFNQLETEVWKQVKDYHARHSGAYFFFRKLFFKDVDQIANNLIGSIHLLETKLNPILNQYITNPTTNNANLLPIPEEAFFNIAQFLDVNELTAITKTAKQGNDTIKNTRLLKAQEFGYQGNDLEGAEQYLNTLGKTIDRFQKIESEFHPIYRDDGKTIDLEKTLKTANERDYIRFALNRHSFPEKDAKILWQCWLHLINQNEANGITLKGLLRYPNMFAQMYNEASKTGEFDAIEILLKMSLNNAESVLNRVWLFPNFSSKQTPLQQAVRTRNEPLTKFLIKYRAKVNYSRWYHSPLELAIKNGDLKIARVLLEAGTKTDMGKERRIALYKAIERDQQLFIPLLKEYKADFDLPTRGWQQESDTPLQLAIRRKNLEMLKVLLDNGADINKGSWDKSPLHFAFEMKDKKAAEYLLVQKANHENQGESGTALSWACNAGFLDVAQNLLHTGDDPNRPGPDGLFPLSLTRSTKALQFLKKNGANPNAEDAQGNTPLSQAIEASDWTQVDRLIALGADIHHKNAQGQTVMVRFGNSHWFRLKLRGA